MKIVTFQGGLGNQMFQYQFYLWLAKNTDEQIYGYFPANGLQGHNGLEVESVFRNVLLPKSSLFTNLLSKSIKALNRVGLTKRIITEKNFHMKGLLFEDYWLNLKYDTSFKFEINDSVLVENIKNKIILDKIIAKNSISIHIRRGDYTTNKNAEIYLGVCDVDYYNNAIQYIIAHTKDAQFYVFSDDIEWVINNLKIPNANYIDWNTGNKSYIDLYLMSQCKHNIIANSTFSWWGAYNNYKAGKIVIAPNKWFGSSKFVEPHIFQKEWIRI